MAQIEAMQSPVYSEVDYYEKVSFFAMSSILFCVDFPVLDAKIY